MDFNYTADPDFDADAWLADVEGRACSGNSLCTVADVVAAVRDGHTTTKALVDHLKEVYVASKRTAERLIGRAVKVGGLQQVARGKYGLGEKSQKILSQ